MRWWRGRCRRILDWFSGWERGEREDAIPWLRLRKVGSMRKWDFMGEPKGIGADIL